MSGPDKTVEPVDINAPIRVRPGTTKQWETLCQKCGLWVGLSGKTNFHTLETHQDGHHCHQATVERERKAQVATAQQMPTFSTTRALSRPPTFQSVSPDLAIVMTFTTPSPPPPFFSPIPSLVLPEHMQCIPPAMLSTEALPVLQMPHSLSPAMTKAPCPDIQLKWICKCPVRTYPFQYHDTGNLTWFAMAVGPHDPDVIYPRSTSCTLSCDPYKEACTECTKIPSSLKFQSLVWNASKDPASTMPHIFQSWQQLLSKLKNKTDKCRQLWKKVCLTSML